MFLAGAVLPRMLFRGVAQGAPGWCTAGGLGGRLGTARVLLSFGFHYEHGLWGWCHLVPWLIGTRGCARVADSCTDRCTDRWQK